MQERQLTVCAQVFNYLAGALARVFTTLQEVNDKTILYGYIAGFVLNAVLAVQMVYYWNAPAAKSQAPVKKGEVKETAKQAAPVAASSGAQAKSKRPTTRRRA